MLIIAEAACLAGSASQSIADTMAILVCDDTVVKIAIEISGAIGSRDLERDRQPLADKLAQVNAVRIFHKDSADIHLITNSASCHSDEIIFKITDNDPHSTCLLSVERLAAELTGATIDECDFTGNIVDDSATSECW